MVLNVVSATLVRRSKSGSAPGTAVIAGGRLRSTLMTTAAVRLSSGSRTTLKSKRRSAGTPSHGSVSRPMHPPYRGAPASARHQGHRIGARATFSLVERYARRVRPGCMDPHQKPPKPRPPYGRSQGYGAVRIRLQVGVLHWIRVRRGLHRGARLRGRARQWGREIGEASLRYCRRPYSPTQVLSVLSGTRCPHEWPRPGL